MDLPQPIPPIWTRFVTSAGLNAEDAAARYYETFHFDDHESAADELAALVLRGQKRATAGLLWTNEATGKPIPKPGDLSIVTLWSGEPICVIESTTVEIVPFDDVNEAFAATEGEDDGSLRSWRAAHWRYFSRECARIGREPSSQMPVVCETFRVVYSEGASENANAG